MNEVNLDEIVKITISDSGFSAYITIISDSVEQSLPYEKVFEMLKKKNVIYGVDENLLIKVCESPKKYLWAEVEIAKGLLPIDGESGSVEWKINLESRSKPVLLEDGSVDFYNLNKILNIRKGELLAEKISATSGTPGKNIFGKEIPAKSGREVQLKVGKNVLLNPNKDKLYAGIDGQLVLTDNDKINIFPIFEVVGDVDFGIGNIDFVGTVIVKGNVPDGFKIRADGEIKIYGNVDGAELIAEGDIFIQQGIIGHNKSYIETKKSLTTSFILDADIKAKEDVIVNKSIMHSNISAGRRIICQNDKGIIVGGNVHATLSIIANIIGNEHTTMTSIEVGVNPELKDEIREIHKEKKELEIKFDKVDKGLMLFEKLEETNQNLSPEKQRMKMEFTSQKMVIQNRLKEIREQEEILEERIENASNAFIEVKKVIYPGVKIVIGRAVNFIKEEIKYARFVLEDEEIKVKK